MKVLFVWIPRIIIGILLAVVLFVTIPTYVPYQPCTHGVQPYPAVAGMPWMTEPCNYAGLAWEAPLMTRLPQLMCIVGGSGACR